jgi:hypothetical protein
MLNPHLENFHADTWQLESAWDSAFTDRGWSKFHDQLALLVFPDLPKTEREGLLDWADGVSLDSAYDLFEQGLRVKEAALEFKLLMAAADGGMI